MVARRDSEDDQARLSVQRNGFPSSPTASGEAASTAADSAMVTMELESDVRSVTPQQTRAWSRARILKAAALGGAAVVIAVAVAVVLVVYVNKTSKPAVNVPKTFSAEFTTQNKLIPTLAYTGRAYKTEDAAGNWHWQFVVETDNTRDPSATIKTVYTIMDRRAYEQRFDLANGGKLIDSRCLSSDDVPPLADLTDLLTNSAVVPNDEFNQEAVADCAGSEHEKVVLQWGNPTSRSQNAFVYCAMADGTHRFVSQQHVASVFHVDLSPPADGLGLTTPVDATGTAMSCDEVNPPSVLAQMGTATASSRRLAAAAAWYAANAAVAARRLAATRACIFVPGSEYTTGSTQSGYWGPVEKVMTAKCSTFQFLTNNMRDLSYSDPSIINAICQSAVSAKLPANTMIFSHGTGSLSVAHAFSSGACQMATGAKWYAIAAPSKGSPVASALDGKISYIQVPGGVCSYFASDAGIMTYANAVGGCKGTSASTVMKAVSGITGTNDMTTLRSTIASKANGIMCGISTDGSGSPLTNKFASADQIQTQGETFDGFVFGSACNPGSKSLSTTYTNNLYSVSNANFLDVTCRTGDAVLDLTGNRSPCSWFRERTGSECAYNNC